MTSRKLSTLKAISLTLLLPGIAGMIVSAIISGHYLDTMPQLPVPQQQRTVPRSIHGIVVYQTVEEDQKLDLIEYSSVTCFGFGLVLGLIYMEKWGSSRPELGDEDDALSENFG